MNRLRRAKIVDVDIAHMIRNKFNIYCRKDPSSDPRTRGNSAIREGARAPPAGPAPTKQIVGMRPYPGHGAFLLDPYRGQINILCQGGNA
jgi:hypothetical protein